MITSEGVMPPDSTSQAVEVRTGRISYAKCTVHIPQPHIPQRCDNATERQRATSTARITTPLAMHLDPLCSIVLQYVISFQN